MALTRVSSLSESLLTTERRTELAALAATAAGLALSGAIVLSPFRARILLSERPLQPVFGDFRDFLLFWNELLVIGVLVLWGASLLLQPRRVEFGPLLVRIPVIVLASAIILSVPFSQDRGLALFHAVTLLGFMGMGLYIVNEVRSAASLAPAMAVMILIQAILAISQVVSQQSFGLADLGELNLDPSVNGISIVWTENAPAILRGYGLSDHPNILGGVIAASLLVMAASLSRLREERLAVVSAVFGLGVAALVVTFSRSAALGFAVGLSFAFVLFLARRDWQALKVWSAACLVALVVTAPLIMPYSDYFGARLNPSSQAVGSPEQRSLSEREALARNTNEIFVDNALVGVGAGVLPTAMKDAFPDFQYNYAPAHIVILVVAAETGILGAFAYGVIMVAPWVLLWLRRGQLTSELIGVSAALLALHIIGLFDYYTWSLTAGRIWFWLILGLWIVAYRRAVDRVPDA